MPRMHSRPLDSFGRLRCLGVQRRPTHWTAAKDGTCRFFVLSGGFGPDFLSSANSGDHRPRGRATLFSFLPLHLDARTLSLDIQRRVLRSTPPPISLGYLGGCGSIESAVRCSSELSQLFQSPSRYIVGLPGNRPTGATWRGAAAVPQTRRRLQLPIR